jgi:RNA-directed DNA polymerase
MFELPVIESVADLADLTCLSPGLLYRLSKYHDKFYRDVDVPKRNGKMRALSCPSARMKAIQAWILRNVLDRVSVSGAAKGFRKGTSILDNVKPHGSGRYFLCLDIEDFFPSIRYPKVYSVFRTIGYKPHVAHILSSLCTHNQKLPQGGVTSPALSNIVCMRMDRRISGYVGKRNVTYTRYADDMTLSGMSPRQLARIEPFIKRVIQEEGFVLNETKTRHLGPRRRREVTGLVVSSASIGIGRNLKRRLRASIHRVLATQTAGDDIAATIRRVNGWLAYLNAVDEPGLRQLRDYTAKLQLRHKICWSPFVFPKPRAVSADG